MKKGGGREGGGESQSPVSGHSSRKAEKGKVLTSGQLCLKRYIINDP